MRVYYYTPADLGVKEFPPGHMRLAGAEAVTDPKRADVFVLPPILHHFKPQLARLPYLAGAEPWHVFWNLADDYLEQFQMPALFLRAEATKEIVAASPTTRGWPWPVDDLYASFESFDLDVVFQGWASTPLTNAVVESVRNTPQLRAHLELHDFFYGYHDTEPAYAHYRASFIDTLRRSRLSLVPRSIKQGVIRYRFYEALSAGRVPVHFCDGRVLPWADRIDYDRCSLHIPEAKAPYAGEIIAAWLADHSDEQIREMGEYGRAMWLRWLDPREWDHRFTEAVQGHFGL